MLSDLNIHLSGDHLVFTARNAIPPKPYHFPVALLPHMFNKLARSWEGDCYGFLETEIHWSKGDAGELYLASAIPSFVIALIHAEEVQELWERMLCLIGPDRVKKLELKKILVVDGQDMV